MHSKLKILIQNDISNLTIPVFLVKSFTEILLFYQS